MKRISCFLLLSTLLASCATSARYSFGSVATPTPVVTEINAPTATAVFTPTSQPTPPETAAFTIDALDLDPALSAALKKHAGLEASITAEAEGKFSTSVQVLNQTGQPVTETMQVDPKTLYEDLASKNEYGNTPVMTTVDGKKLYWIQEEKAWFTVEISPDIHAPVLIPYGKTEIPLRVTIAEFPEAFSEEAVNWWKNTPGLEIGFQYLVMNANTGESSKFAYLRNQAMGFPGRTQANSPVQIIDAWFAMTMPDGTQYEFFPTKWLDPANPRNPKGDEWKIIFAASGPEIMSDEANRNAYDAMLAQAATPGTRMEVLPIVRVQNGFFNSVGPLITLFVAQPSLAKLSAQVDKDFGALLIPNNTSKPAVAERYYKYWLDGIFRNLSASSPGLSFRFQDKNDPAWTTYFFPDEAQTLVYPSLITIR